MGHAASAGASVSTQSATAGLLFNFSVCRCVAERLALLYQANSCEHGNTWLVRSAVCPPHMAQEVRRHVAFVEPDFAQRRCRCQRRDDFATSAACRIRVHLGAFHTTAGLQAAVFAQLQDADLTRRRSHSLGHHDESFPPNLQANHVGYCTPRQGPTPRQRTSFSVRSRVNNGADVCPR